MILRAYSIFDNKALVYHPPFFQPTDGAATRLLHNMVNDQGTNIGRHPADYILYCVGTYDDQKGSMDPFSPLLHVMDAVALVAIAPELFNKAAE